MKDTKTLIAEFLKLQHNYQFTRRTMMTKERFKDIAFAEKSKGLDITDTTLNEPLIEHIGHLPIIATYFHEHIEHVSKVDLGRALIMISIHDIGETRLGDVFAYTKTEVQEVTEFETAKSLLSPSLILFLEEYELNISYDAKFAKSVDILGSLLHAIDLIGYTYARFLKHGGSIEKIIQKQRPFLEWDLNLLEIFDMCIEQASKYENGEELIFEVADYDIK